MENVPTEQIVKEHLDLQHEYRSADLLEENRSLRDVRMKVGSERAVEICRRAFELNDQLALLAVYRGYVDIKPYVGSKIWK